MVRVQLKQWKEKMDKKIKFTRCWNCYKRVLSIINKSEYTEETIYIFHNASKCKEEDLK